MGDGHPLAVPVRNYALLFGVAFGAFWAYIFLEWVARALGMPGAGSSPGSAMDLVFKFRFPRALMLCFVLAASGAILSRVFDSITSFRWCLALGFTYAAVYFALTVSSDSSRVAVFLFSCVFSVCVLMAPVLGRYLAQCIAQSRVSQVHR
jgi:hypothetical protein